MGRCQWVEGQRVLTILTKKKKGVPIGRKKREEDCDCVTDYCEQVILWVI